jgi:cell division protein FtsW
MLASIFDTTKQKPDYALLIVVGILVPLGLVMVYSASFVDGITMYQNPMYYTWRQLTAAVIGTIGLVICQRIDYRIWRRFSVHLLAATLLLLLMVLMLPPSITEVNGARQWIRLGFFSVQPSELAKLSMLIYFADWLSRRGERLGNVTYGLIPFGVTLGVVCGLVMAGGDLGTTIVLIMIAGTVYFAAGANVLHIGGAVVLAGAAFWAMVKIAPYRQERIAAWLDPFAYYSHAGYQPVHALYALASGGIFGEGLGQSRQKFQWLPQSYTDTIFAIIGEEFGLIGTVFLVGCFLFIAYRGFLIAGRLNDPFASLLAIGLTGWLVFQALLNIAVVISLLPFTGITLPLLSYGGTSLMITMVAVGILLNLSRHTVERPQAEPTHAVRTGRPPNPLIEAVPQWWWDRWARVSGASSRRGATTRTRRRRTTKD